MVSIVDVARHSGFGIATVSRVINGRAGVGMETRQAIHQAMADLAYKVPEASRRRGPKGPKDAKDIVCRFEARILFAGGLERLFSLNPIMTDVLGALDERLNRAGHSLIVCNNAAQSSRKPDGMVILAPHDPKVDLFRLCRGIPTVQLMGSPAVLVGDHIHPVHQRIGQLAAEYLLARGHRHLAYLGTRLGAPDWSVGERASAYRWWAERGGATVSMLIHGDLLASPDRLVPQLLDGLGAGPQRPSAILVEMDRLTPFVYDWLKKEGIRPMRELEIVTCNNETEFIGALKPRPIVINIHPEEMGRIAAERLLFRVQHPDARQATFGIMPELIVP